MSSSTSDDYQFNNFFQSNLFTAILVGLFVVEVIAIGTYTYRDVRSKLNPTHLVDQAEKALRQNYPDIRKNVTRDIQQNAPQIAESLSNQLVATTPEVRQWLEDATRRQLKYTLDETTELSAEEFLELLQNNHDEIEDAFQQLEEVPQLAQQSVLDLETNIDKSWGVNLKSQAENALELHQLLNDKLDRLTSNAPLTPKELLERRMLRILRTLERERLPELPQISPPE